MTDQHITANLNITEQAQASDRTTAVVGLNQTQLRKVGEQAARVAGLPFKAVAITVETDVADKPAYFFNYSIARSSTATGTMLGQVSRELRDRLLELGDAVSPYVRITSH